MAQGATLSGVSPIAIELSSNMLIKIDVGTALSPKVYSTIGNQQNGALSLSANQIDAANKTSAGFAPVIAGLRQFQVTVDGQADPADTVLNKLVTNAVAGTAFGVDAVMYSTGHGYTATCQATQMEINGPNQQPTQYRSTMSLSTGSPTLIRSP
jgi:predicted secreted protein